MSPAMLAAVAAGGALGATLRYLTMVQVGHWIGHGFPWGTVVVNLLGSVVMGALVEALALRFSIGPETRAFLVVGLLGGYTTFSTFSLDLVTLMERGTVWPAALYLGLSVSGGVLALVAGMRLVRLGLAP